MQTKLPLNQGQEHAANVFFDFLLGPHKEMIISGPAGTGKTFLMGHLINEVMPRYQATCELIGTKALYQSVEMTATTNKAAQVLEEATGYPTSTIHSFMNLKVQDDYQAGRTKIVKTKNWRVHEGIILFVDEAFTLDSQMRSIILEGTKDCKIVYVGDACQLGPVMEAKSPLDGLNIPTVELTEPMRNAEFPTLKALCDQFRNTVKTQNFLPIHLDPGVIDLFDDTQMENALNNDFPLHDNARILAYTNNKVIAYNDYVRQVRQLPTLLTDGERVINNTGIQLSKKMLGAEAEVTVLNASNKISKVYIGDGADLEVQITDLVLPGGEIEFAVSIPTDRDHYQSLLKYFAKQKNWERYFFLKNTFPDLRPRDAQTTHKAQGSTYDIVYIDLGDLSSCHRPDLASRLFYVAISRAKRRVIFYGDLAEKYGSIVR
jgi:exodeoxyribonuclease V